MIDARRLALLPRGAILINVARGPLVVEDDLVAALESGQLARRGPRRDRGRAAAADEPAVGFAQRDHHAARRRPAATRIDDMTNFFCDNLARYLAGRPLRNLVDKRIGLSAAANQQSC